MNKKYHPLVAAAVYLSGVVGVAHILGQTPPLWALVLMSFLSVVVTAPQLTPFVRNHLIPGIESVGDWIAQDWRFLAPFAVAGVLISAFNIGADPEALSEPWVKELHYYAHQYGFILPLLIFSVQEAIRAAFDGRFNVYRMIGRGIVFAVWLTVFYSAALWGIATYGDSLYQAAIAPAPETIAVLVGALLVVTVINRYAHRVLSLLCDRFEASSGGYSHAAGGFVSKQQMVSSIPMGPKERRAVAIHEAGHVLAHAALGSVPPDMKVVVQDHVRNNEPRGYVSNVSRHYSHCLQSERFSHWYMLMFLAGGTSEIVVNKESSMGSGKDNDCWLQIARSYLESSTRGLYYLEPENEFEQAHNVEVLTSLRNEHVEQLKDFFRLNKGLVETMADALVERGELGRDKLIPYLEEVVFPEGFPMPLGPFEQFSREWESEKAQTA